MATASEPVTGLLFDPGFPERRKPTDDEVEKAVKWAVRLAINKRWRGLPPIGMEWEDLYQAVTLGAWRRIQKFRHGGKIKLRDFAYMAACYELTDLGRANVRRSKDRESEPRRYPLFD
ncbi:MAG: hypothetical protein AMXMBFR7_33120 [Planctomycetota bacterium]